VRIGDEIAHAGRMPVVAPSHVVGRVHPLLHDGPFPGFVNHEGVQVKLKTVSNGVVIDASGEPAGAGQFIAIQPDPAGEFSQLSGVRCECRPRPPQMAKPHSAKRGLSPRLSAPMTEVVMPEECQPIPITQPRA